MSVFHIFQHGEISSLRLCEHARSPREKRYLEKMSCVGIDPVLIPDETYDPVPASCRIHGFTVVFDKSYYSKDQFKAYRSFQTYNQLLVSGFVSSVKGQKIGNKYSVH